eukprot:7009-Amphidinium_carterae.1
MYNDIVMSTETCHPGSWTNSVWPFMAIKACPTRTPHCCKSHTTNFFTQESQRYWFCQSKTKATLRQLVVVPAAWKCLFHDHATSVASTTKHLLRHQLKTLLIHVENTKAELST